jgi:hypothetical protein
VNLSGGSFNPGTYDVYRLSAHEVDSRLSSVNAGSAITLPAQSTTILTNDYTPVTAGAVTASVLSVQGITPYSCDLRWRNTDPMAVSYDIYRGATMVESSYTIAPYYSATGLQPNTAYSFSLKAKDSQGNYSAFSNTVTFTTHAYQKVIREVWYCPGYRTSDIPLTAAPDKYQELDSINTVGSRAPGGEVNGMTDFFDVTGSNFGSRIRGYFVALASGWYRFYFNSYDYGDLYLSTDSLPANKRRIAWFDTYNVSPADSGVWNRYTGQTSDSISLVSGAWYYLEVLHKVTNHTPRLQVAWSGPGQASPTILRTPYMQPYPSNGMTVGALPRTLPEVKAVLSLAVVNSSTASRTPLVRFCLPSAQGHVALTLNDLQGRVVRRIVDGAVTGGMHVVAIDGSGNAVPAGTYVVRLRAGAIDKSMAVTLAR